MNAFALSLAARRLLPLLAALSGFAVLYAASGHFAGDYELPGISEHTVRGVAHFSVYGMLALMVAAALGRWHLAAWLICILLATVEEVHQLFIPGRFCSMGDWIINACGITFFLLVAWHFGSVRSPGCREPGSESLQPRRSANYRGFPQSEFLQDVS